MRVDSVQSFSGVKKNVRVMGVSTPPSPVKEASHLSLGVITFIGAGKNMRQIASFTPENNGLGLPEAAQGGEGCVGYEVVASQRHHEKMDVRSFMPFWEYNNPKGGYKFLIHRKADFPDGVESLPDQMPAKFFYSANVGQTLEDVARNLRIKPDELSYVIQSRPNGDGPNALSKYCRLDITTLGGEIERLSDTTLGETERIPYRFFKVSKHNPKYNLLKGEPHYFVYTPALARASKPYSYDSWGNGNFGSEIINSDWMRVLSETVHSKMDTPEFEGFNPGSVYCHDRVCHTYANHIANLSAKGNTDVNGLKVHIWVHNSGRNYQGLTGNPFDMLTVVGDVTDAEKLRSLPEFSIMEKAKRLGFDALTQQERDACWAVMEPALRPFRDGAGTYNILKTGIAAVRTNPDNISLGTVSYKFDEEMKSPETPDAAKFLTGDYASIKTKTVLNGVTPANLKLDDKTADFGRGGNGLSAKKRGYTPFSYDGTNIDEVIKIKEKNAKWLTRLIYNAGKKGQDALNELFFNKGQIADGHNVLGYLSSLKKGEILVFSFGRPDEQKGFTITTRGFLEFLKDPNIPKSKKRKVKLLTGAGPWDKNAPDYRAMVRDLEEIWTLDGGIYRHNAMHIDGFTPNRLLGCCTHSIFTSRREMCGITPIESKIAGTPYGATATGGPVDYTNSSNGWLTDEPVELRPERYGLTYENTAEEIDNARVQRQAQQVKTNIFEAMIDEYTDDRPSYVAKCKKNIEEQVDWHNNSEYNRGKSANQRYLEDILEVDKGWEARNKSPMRRLMGEFGSSVKDAESVIESGGKVSKHFRFLYPILATIAVLSGVYFIIRSTNKHVQKKLDRAA
ncbi:MAG: hypothetical protein NC191_09190 [Muribaculaceae bacterium]|nr:hypothetical protein [Muribaculaceae bacterium]